MSEDCGVQLTQLKVDGGMTANDLFVQMQSDLLGATVCKCRLVYRMLTMSDIVIQLNNYHGTVQ